MNAPNQAPDPTEILREVDARMAQALDNFFQRSRHVILEGILHAIRSDLTPSMLARGQTCMDWLNAYPDRLSAAFADQFRLHLTRPGPSMAPGSPTGELRLVDDAQFGRQLEENRALTRITHALGPEMTALFSRLAALLQSRAIREAPQDVYGPQAVIAALSRALDALDFEAMSGTLLLQNAFLPLQDTLRHTYAALNQYLAAQGIQERGPARAPASARRREDVPAIGEDILAHIQAAASRPPALSGLTAAATHMIAAPATVHARGDAVPGTCAVPVPFQDSLDYWQANLARMVEIAPAAPMLVLRQLQQQVHETDAGTFDLAMLDAVAGLFEFILEDPNVSPDYKSEIAQLQIPTLRVALVSPEFFSDDGHPARQMIDLLGLYSRRFPEFHIAHAQALQQVESACTHIINQPDRQLDAFSEAYETLAAWLENESARADAAMASEIATLEQIERQELGTLLALENLQDLTVRYPAPESVLRRLEAAWVPHMASLYVAEAGEGPAWRTACMTLLQLFLSLQAPEDADTREARLQSIPQVNAELRKGLLAQGAEPEQLRDFFGAITATQECWIRPDLGRQEAAVSHFVPQAVAQADIESLARRLTDTPPADPLLQQAESLQEGDWVDFDPPHEGLATARVAWVGVQGYLLFSDSTGETRFSLDSEQLAALIRAGQASIPEQSLTRKAMLRLSSQLQTRSA
ncbi:MAG: DUF1631 family protein [Pseudomonadota bacterium]